MSYQCHTYSKGLPTCKIKPKNGDLTLEKEDENKRSEDLRMRGRALMSYY